MEKLTQDFKIEYIKGDTYALAIKFKNITEDLTTAYLTVKENPDDTTPLIQKSLGAGIDKIDDRAYKNEKTYKFQLNPIDTVYLEPKVQYLYDIQVAVGTVIKTVLHGVFILGSTLTGTSGITTQNLEVAIDDELETELATTPATNGVEYEQDPVACTKIGDMNTLATTNKETIVKSVNEVNAKALNNTQEINKIKDGTTVVPNATKATDASNVKEFINGQLISTIFEDDGITAKNATKAGLADKAYRSVYTSDDTFGQLIFGVGTDRLQLDLTQGFIEQKRLIHYGETESTGEFGNYGDITITIPNDITINDGDILEFDLKSGAFIDEFYRRIQITYSSRLTRYYINYSFGLDVDPYNLFLIITIENNTITISPTQCRIDGELMSYATYLLRITKILGLAI